MLEALLSNSAKRKAALTAFDSADLRTSGLEELRTSESFISIKRFTVRVKEVVGWPYPFMRRQYLIVRLHSLLHHLPRLANPRRALTRHSPCCDSSDPGVAFCRLLDYLCDWNLKDRRASFTMCRGLDFRSQGSVGSMLARRMTF